MKINRICTLVTLLALLLLAATLVYGLNLWNIRGVQTSDVYRRYADTPGVNAAYIKDYRVNDSVTVCVTLLEATDSASWDKLLVEFKVPIIEEVTEAVAEGRDLVTSCVIPVNPDDSSNEERFVLATSHLNKTICIFHTENKEQRYAVLHYNYHKGNNFNKKTP